MSEPATLGEWLDALPLGRRHWRVFAVCAAAFLFDAMDVQILSLAAPSLAREWGLTSGATGLLLSSTAVGMLFGAFSFGLVSDRMGRRFAFQATVLIFAVFSLLCAFAQDSGQLMLLRFATGVGIGGFIPVDTAIMTEFLPAAPRGRMLGLWTVFLPLGNLAAAAMGVVVIPALGWRGMFVAGAVPGLLVFLLRRAIPESPRFLLGQGKVDEARRAAAWIADAPVPLGIGLGVTRAPRAAAASLFGPGLLHRAVLLGSIWFAWTFSYFGIVLWLPGLLTRTGLFGPAQIYAVVIGFAACGIAGRVTTAFLLDRAGRRWTLMLFGTGAAVAALAFGVAGSRTALLLAGAALAFCQDGGAGCFAAWTPELFPTGLRATGVGLANGAGRVATILSPALAGALLASQSWAVTPMFAAGFALAVAAVALLGRETKGMNLDAASAPDPITDVVRAP